MKNKSHFEDGRTFLDYLNATYSKLHKAYEDDFWTSYMGDHSVDKRMNEAQTARDAFRADPKLKAEAERLVKESKGKTASDRKIKDRLKLWIHFFSLYQAPPHAAAIKAKATALDAKIMKIQTSIKEGYTDPKTKKFVRASHNRMRFIMRTHPDEAVRKACFKALEKLPFNTIDEYIKVIGLRNEYARALGFSDFYEYKARIDENMTKKELFSIFDKIYKRTKYAFKDIRSLEKRMAQEGKPGLRRPWNMSYMLAGDFAKEEDQYYRFEDALSYWGRSFAALGIGFKGGTVKLDLLDRKGKHHNGFCHYPTLVQYKNGKRIPGSSGIASNTVLNQPGANVRNIDVLFHEGGHAADRLNSMQPDACINSEYPPSSVSWAETHSMFMDAMYHSIEWRTRYAKDEKGEPYPFDLFERKLKAIQPLRPLGLMYIIFVVFFEKEVYECKRLTRTKLIEIAKRLSRKYSDYSEDTINILNLPHIYSWESSAYYHGYGLAELGVSQWREYFYMKYGYIVDNSKVGAEMTRMWSYASLYPAKKLVKMATGKPLSPEAFIRDVTDSYDTVIKRAEAKIERLKKVPQFKGKIDLDGHIIIVHGKNNITDNSKGFEHMDKKYREWLKTVK
ncbi:MAG: hypothetical protein KGI49_00500 [Patescibacteria group bacterium]|nr:hypothetical protein [Patescibacteria group bacterium]